LVHANTATCAGNCQKNMNRSVLRPGYLSKLIAVEWETQQMPVYQVMGYHPTCIMFQIKLSLAIQSIKVKVVPRWRNFIFLPAFFNWYTHWAVGQRDETWPLNGPTGIWADLPLFHAAGLEKMGVEKMGGGGCATRPAVSWVYRSRKTHVWYFHSKNTPVRFSYWDHVLTNQAGASMFTRDGFRPGHDPAFVTSTLHGFRTQRFI
jgi:hypothetical protein